MHLNITMTVGNISAQSFHEAKVKAFAYIAAKPETFEILKGLGFDYWVDFEVAARCYRNTDQTYTVTIP